MRIKVAQGDWGDTRIGDLEVLLTDVASHILRLLREPPIESIVVAPTSSRNDDPITLYRASPKSPFWILLQARDKYWAKYVFQFSHELCHVLSDYERLRDSPNNWFHETICELASVFTLRRMAERWPSCPPFPNWAGYAGPLASYAQERLSRKEHQLPAGMTLSAFLLAEEETLRKNRYLRDKNAVVAYSLLPIFESESAGWNALRKLPNSHTMFKDYLREWHSQVDTVDKPVVNRIIQLFSE